jgi:YebC/PmpR family DNA-binding regulatory protein
VAGHSKWANIKHRKERSDAKKGKLFSKIGRELLVAAKQGEPDPEANSKLKDAIAKARAANMPNDNIMRIIKRAAGDLDSENYEEITYEGYGPGGVAVIVDVMTDNRNRTAGEIRHYFDRFGGNLGQTGCVSFLFDKKGVILIEKIDSIDEETLMMDAVNAGAEDFDVQDEFFEILTEPADFSVVREDLEKKGYSFISAGIEMIPGTTVKLVEQEHIEKMSKLIDSLEDMDDVQNVYHNWEQD